MHAAFSIALAGLFSLSCFDGAGAQNARRLAIRPLKQSETLAYTLQTVSVQANCFPPRLRGILAYIAARTGRRPLVTSGLRSRGRSHSQHRHCAAADIRVAGVSDRTIIAIAETAPGIGGIGRYCNGIVHVDIGPKRRWVHC
ncbi:D-Ala-D-Ala carboxypeptidase family metallohydrolase [Rhizobium sp. Root1220]|uniref:YcbK family protein n=1 Tax=Rhizobium sp. Root1220 TaxID=1736432 RepID=UPI000701A377|nr:D-Ala-D-Ala carboxypeptidase family metallohydrolase [Rhizobium sp. Root1220]KQV84151.1 peptidase M15 [Rhizobium sp. Root1220]